MTFGNAIEKEAAWTTTWNGADTLNTTFSSCLDLFGRAGAMRNASAYEKQALFAEAFKENPITALRLLFYIRDIRGGYGERDTFTDMLRWLANEDPEMVSRNMWGILEFGRAKDFYSLIGTKSESIMWKYIHDQFWVDYDRMKANESISLLSKWIATPDASSKKTAALGIQTAKAIGFDYKHMKDYKKILREMRRYLDIPEAKMCAGKWSEIDYSKLGSQCLLKYRRAFAKHDEKGYQAFIDNAKKTPSIMNTKAMTPCDIMHRAINNYTPDLEVMWNNLEDYCDSNVFVMCDTSGSMTWRRHDTPILPIEVATSLSIYFAERNKGDLKDLFMTFESDPHIVKIKGETLADKFTNILTAGWGSNTNLEKAFLKLLDICKKNNISEMPEAIMIISDMQIDSAVKGIDRNNKITFYDDMKEIYAKCGYKIPHIIFWNVNAVSPAFHAAKSDNGVSLVSGYSPVIFKSIMSNIGTTPLELMMSIVNSERYSLLN